MSIQNLIKFWTIVHPISGIENCVLNFSKECAMGVKIFPTFKNVKFHRFTFFPHFRIACVKKLYFLINSFAIQSHSNSRTTNEPDLSLDNRTYSQIKITTVLYNLKLMEYLGTHYRTKNGIIEFTNNVQ